mmetsp:Transcript_12714/g.27449  ORF Transcript_12714/g.27449 Transcript_12714/m.27449 type:complete len:203 (+) Transcript_12714:185-793(+)
MRKNGGRGRASQRPPKPKRLLLRLALRPPRGWVQHGKLAPKVTKEAPGAGVMRYLIDLHHGEIHPLKASTSKVLTTLAALHLPPGNPLVSTFTRLRHNPVSTVTHPTSTPPFPPTIISNTEIRTAQHWETPSLSPWRNITTIANYLSSPHARWNRMIPGIRQSLPPFAARIVWTADMRMTLRATIQSLNNDPHSDTPPPSSG